MATKEQITNAYQSGKLIDVLFRHTDLNELNQTAVACIELHNSGAIDFLSLTQESGLNSIPATDFFSGQSLFCKIVPKLQASTAAMMRAVDALVQQGGSDLAANRPNAAFRDWCGVDLATTTLGR